MLYITELFNIKVIYITSELFNIWCKTFFSLTDILKNIFNYTRKYT